MYRRSAQVQDLIRRLSAISAGLAACLDSIIAELQNSNADPDPYLIRCAQNIASTQIAITRQILVLTNLIEGGGETVLLGPQPVGNSDPISQLHMQYDGYLDPAPDVPIGLLQAPAAFQHAVTQNQISKSTLEPNEAVSRQTHERNLRRAAVIYAPRKSVLSPLGWRLLQGAAQRISTRHLIGVLCVVILGIGGLTLGESKTDQNISHPEHAEGPLENTEVAASASTPDAPDHALTRDDVIAQPPPARLQDTIVLSAPREPAIVVVAPAEPDNPEDIGNQPVREVVTHDTVPPKAPGVPRAIQKAPSENTPETKPPKPLFGAMPEAQPKASLGAKPAAFKTTVKTEPVPAQKFAAAILALRDGKAALQIYRDLQNRHAGVLGNKKGELRSFNGPDQTPWVQVLVLPPSSKEDAQAICQNLGAEGAALGCKVVSY